MEISNIIPEYLLKQPQLLTVYCYLLRIVRADSWKLLHNGEIISLKAYEACGSVLEISERVGLDDAQVESAIANLVNLDLLTLRKEDDLYLVKFRYLVLPKSPDSSREIVDYTDCWFDEFTNDYLEYVGTNLANKTYQNAARVMKLFGRFIGRKKLSELSGENIEKYKTARREEGVMDTTINMDIRTLKAAMEVAVNFGKLQANPFRKVKQIRVTRKAIRPFTKDEFALLSIQIKEPWLRPIIEFAVLTGLRRGEILNLQWKDVDLEGGYITIQSSEEYRVKNGKVRQLPLNQGAKDILNCLDRETEWVFTSVKGERLNDDFVSKKFKGYIRKVGLGEELHFHSLRATHASWGLREGIPIYAIKNLLGHASVKTTEIYASHDQESLRMEVEKISLPG